MFPNLFSQKVKTKCHLYYYDFCDFNIREKTLIEFVVMNLSSAHCQPKCQFRYSISTNLSKYFKRLSKQTKTIFNRIGKALLNKFGLFSMNFALKTAYGNFPEKNNLINTYKYVGHCNNSERKNSSYSLRSV